MPFKSEAQRRYLWAKHPDIARRWSKKYGSKPVSGATRANKDAVLKENYRKGPKGERVHRIVARAVGKGFQTVVHHKNGNKHDNRPSNLATMSRARHAQETHTKYPKRRKCAVCGKAFTPSPTHRDGTTKTCGPKCAHQQMSRSAKRRG